MFKQLEFSGWAVIGAIVTFVLTAAVFALVVWRAIRMPKAEVRRMSRLPLTEEIPEKNDERGK